LSLTPTGQINTTLAALARLVDDYDSMARKEMVTAAREKANTYVQWAASGRDVG
jgi:hypothetical protein